MRERRYAMSNRFHGTIQGNMIVVDENLGLNTGEKVEFQIIRKPLRPIDPDGFRRAAGALADEWTEEDDRILEKIYLDRKRKSNRDNLP
jgi:hypothetical protein